MLKFGMFLQLLNYAFLMIGYSYISRLNTSN